MCTNTNGTMDKCCEIRKVAYTCRYTSGHQIPTLQSITMTELGSTSISAGIGNLPYFTTFSCSLVSLLFCSLIPNPA